MIRARESRMCLAGLLVAALLGTWVGHSLEYLRVWGPSRFHDAVSRSVHTYMGPVGALLLLLATVGLGGSVRLARRLERRLGQLRAGRAGAHAGGTTGPALAAWQPRWTTLVAALWPVQLGLYVVQENLEARALGLRTPGFGTVTGVHAPAPFVHLLVAAVAAGVVWLARHRVGELVEEVRRAEVLAAFGRRPLPSAEWSAGLSSSTPLQRWGAQLWARPPPLTA